MHYSKLVRDNIPGIIKQKGGYAQVHSAGAEEYWLKLKEKFSEEAAEFVEAETIEELADVLEVIAAIQTHKKWSTEEIKKVQDKKRYERGGFEKRIILEEA